jgi:hypothetical protein
LAWLIAAQNRLLRSLWRFHLLLFASRFKHNLAESKADYSLRISAQAQPAQPDYAPQAAITAFFDRHDD